MVKKINLIEFIPTLGNGGAEALVREYALGMNKDKFNVQIVLLWNTENSANDIFYDRFSSQPLVIFKRRNLFTKTLNKVIGRKYVGLYIKRLVRKYDVDVIHAHLDAINYLMFLGKYLTKIKILYTIHTEARLYFESDAPCKERATSLKKIEENGGNVTIIALHDEMKREICERYGFKKCEKLYNGIDLDRFSNCSIDREEYRSKIGIPSNAFVIGNVGRFTEAKNHEFIIEVFEKVLQSDKNAFLLLVGNGELKQVVEQQIQERKINDRVLILSGRFDIPELFKCMDLFFMPSLYEGLPMAAVEAQASGINCLISSNVTKEVAFGNVCMLDLNFGIDVWANAIMNFNSNVKLSESIDSFDIKNVIRELEGIIIEK